MTRALARTRPEVVLLASSRSGRHLQTGRKCNIRQIRVEALELTITMSGEVASQEDQRGSTLLAKDRAVHSASPSPSVACDDQRPSPAMVEDIAGPAGRSQSPPVDLSDEQRRRAGAWWWPLSRRATLFSATSLLASGGIVGYALSQGKSSQNDFLLFTPVPPGERWSLAVDTAIEKASRFGSWLSTASQPLLYVLEKGFGGMELVAEHTIVFFYAHTFSWLVVIGGTWLATYMAKEAWKKYIWPEPKRKPAEEPIVRLEVNTEQSGADESSQGSVNVSVHVDRTRLLRRPAQFTNYCNDTVIDRTREASRSDTGRPQTDRRIRNGVLPGSAVPLAEYPPVLRLGPTRLVKQQHLGASVVVSHRIGHVWHRSL